MLPSPLHSQLLPHQSLSSSTPLSSISLSLSSHASYGQSVSLLLVLWLDQQATLLTLAWLLPFIRLTNKVESKQAHRYTYEANTHTHTDLFTALDIWRVSWVLSAICWCKKAAKPRAKKRVDVWCSAVDFHIFGWLLIHNKYSFLVNVIIKVSVLQSIVFIKTQQAANVVLSITSIYRLMSHEYNRNDSHTAWYQDFTFGKMEHLLGTSNLYWQYLSWCTVNIRRANAILSITCCICVPVFARSTTEGFWHFV